MHAEIVKECSELELSWLLNICKEWTEWRVPEDLRMVVTVFLYNNKGDNSEYKTYKGISLSVIGKLYGRIIVKYKE